MPAVIRVKRRIDEEPLSAFVLNSKRRRVDENDPEAAAIVDTADDVSVSGLPNKEELSTLLKFAGTISEQDDSATTQFARLTKEEARELVLRKTRKPVNATEKARKEMRHNLQEQRFRVVNCLRTTLEDNENNGNSNRSKEITIVDIEKQNATDKTASSSRQQTKATLLAHGNNEASTSAAAAAADANILPMETSSLSSSSTAATLSSTAPTMMPSDSDTGYVYDLYIPDNEQHADYVDLLDENYLSVRPFDDLVYEDRYNNDVEDDDDYDSEDSNQENYIGNDYPDEDEDPDAEAFEDEDDDADGASSLARGLNKFVFDDDDDECDSIASSDDDDANYQNAYHDPYVHAIDADEENFCADVDSCDVDRYGLAYAKYKARILKRNKIRNGEPDDEDEMDESKNSFSRDMDDSSTEDSCDYDAYYDTVTGEDY